MNDVGRGMVAGDLRVRVVVVCGARLQHRAGRAVMDVVVYGFGAAAVAWVAGYGAGQAAAFVRRLRNAAG